MPQSAASDDPAQALRALVAELRSELERDDPAADAEIFETHISIVLLAGDCAYKFKKPVDFGFLDFTTLEQRRHYCDREVELNRRTAPELYLGVVAVARSNAGLRVSEAGDALEYAVKMRRFDNAARLDRLLEAEQFDEGDARQLATAIATFHARSAVADAGSPYGTPARTRAQILDAFVALRDRGGIDSLEIQTGQLITDLEPAIAARKAAGHVRRCHGDLHLSNIIRHGGDYLPFDCIEFSDDLSWIDTASDIAFLIMDLDNRDRSSLANRFLNRYLELSGDFEACAVLRLYTLYRTLVRAKVGALAEDSEGETAAARRDRHLDLAGRYLAPRTPPALIITHGLSGSGKSTVAAALADAAGYIHVRSDLERRRLAGLAMTARSGSAPGAGLYTPEHNEATYRRLLAIAAGVVTAGLTVIIDATFLEHARRQAFSALATRLEVPFVILDCAAPAAVLRERIVQREREGVDPSEATLAVLERQIETRDPLDTFERGLSIEVSGESVATLLVGAVARHGGRLAGW